MTYNYLLFRIYKNLFTVSVNNVLEVFEKQKNTPGPNAPNFVLRIIDFREEVVPVIDSWAKLNFHVLVLDSSNEQRV